MTAGDLFAASFITGRDIQIARDDRFYATPSIKSLREVYENTVRSIRSDLIALECPLPQIQVVESDTENFAVGSTICPTAECVREAVSKLAVRISGLPGDARALVRAGSLIEQHNLFTLYTVMMVGWVVGFRAIKDPFIYPSELDFESGLTAFQDKGPKDQTKSRLMRIPGMALAQIEAYSKYQRECLSLFPNELQGRLYFIEELPNGFFFRQVTASVIEQYLEEYLPLPANASRHFGRTELIERGFCPQYVSAWLAHFFRGEEPWGKYLTFSFKNYCGFMQDQLPKVLKQDLGFRAIDNDGREIIDYGPDIERFRRRGEARARASRKS